MVLNRMLHTYCVEDSKNHLGELYKYILGIHDNVATRQLLGPVLIYIDIYK